MTKGKIILQAKYWRLASMKTYIELFNEGFSDDDKPELSEYHFDENIGLMVLFDEYFLNYDDEIVYCVENQIPSEKLLRYYDELVEKYAETSTFPSFKHWLKGAPPLKEDSRYWNRNYRIVEAIKRRAIKEHEEMKNANL